MKFVDIEKENGFTLLEAVLSLAIGTMVLASVGMAFQAGRYAWKKSSQRSELLQHARIGMARMTSELRYATSLQSLTSSGLMGFTFATNNLLDNDTSTTEVIEYRAVSTTLDRSAAGGPFTVIAGDPGKIKAYFPIPVSPLKLSSSGNVVPLGADPLSTAIGMEIHFKVEDAANANNSVELVSRVKFRSK